MTEQGRLENVWSNYWAKRILQSIASHEELNQEARDWRVMSVEEDWIGEEESFRANAEKVGKRKGNCWKISKKGVINERTRPLTVSEPKHWNLN